MTTLPPRLACNLVYGHLVARMDAEGREKFDAFLWSDPARENAILAAVTAPDPEEVA